MADDKLQTLMQMLQRGGGGGGGGRGGRGGGRGPRVEDADDKPSKPKIHQVAKKGTPQELQDYINEHPDEINTLNTHYGTPLHRAVQVRGYEKVKILLDNGADPNLWAEPIDEEKPRDFPCLFTALAGQDVVLLRLLARGGPGGKANLNILGPGKRHPLHHAVIIARDNEAGDPIVIVEEYFKLAKELSHEIHVNWSSESVYDKTPLHISVGANFVATARFLIANGANVDAQDKDGWVSLHVAASKEHPAMIRLLLASGASMNIRSTDRNNYLPSEMEVNNRHCRTAFLMGRTGAAFENRPVNKPKEAN